MLQVGPGGIFGRENSAGTIVPGDEVLPQNFIHTFTMLFLCQGTIKSLSEVGTDQGTMVEHGTGRYCDCFRRFDHKDQNQARA